MLEAVLFIFRAEIGASLTDRILRSLSLSFFCFKYITHLLEGYDWTVSNKLNYLI